ncbi:uncharacterized protein LOC144441056 [Glandiceps talaboti]
MRRERPVFSPDRTTETSLPRFPFRVSCTSDLNLRQDDEASFYLHLIRLLCCLRLWYYGSCWNDCCCCWIDSCSWYWRYHSSIWNQCTNNCRIRCKLHPDNWLTPASNWPHGVVSTTLLDQHLGPEPSPVLIP